jgi:protein phosphatase
MEVESYGISDIGLSRSNNEDVWAELPDIRFYALADGMGGHQAGEVAAKEAVLELCDIIDALFIQNPKPSAEKIAQILKQAFVDANQWVRSLAQQHPELAGMGSTLCCFSVLENTLIYAHVGDSRIYRFRNALTRLTEDHSLRQELLSTGDLDEEAANAFPFKNVITRAIGTNSLVEPHVATTPVQLDDIYFLCSDGLTDYASDDEIEAILKKNSSIKEASIELVETAKNAGGNDNITIVMIKIISL